MIFLKQAHACTRYQRIGLLSVSEVWTAKLSPDSYRSYTVLDPSITIRVLGGWYLEILSKSSVMTTL